MSTISSSGGTIGILYVAGTFSYQINSGSFTTISSWPVTINNTSGSSTLTVSFLGNATFISTNEYFVCGSNNITFDGGLKTMTISGVSFYPGLIRNGTSGSSGYNNITCQNFIIISSSSFLSTNAGWLGQSYFSKGSTGCIITNSYSTGPIASNCGGILGAYAGADSGSITISKCFSVGFISGGGITGDYTANNNGTVIISNCYSNGTVGGGGIIGLNSGIGGTINISNCYSLGNISDGGIVGSSSGSGGTITVSNCFSIGVIGAGFGGIVGASYGNVICTNCYTSGFSSSGSTNGIYAGSSSDNPLGSNNYSEANHGTSGWNNTNATAYLLNGPVGYVQGSVWSDTSFSLNSYWLLSAFNSSIYSPDSDTITSETVYTSGSSILTGTNNQLITVNDSITYSDISINVGTGIITFTNKSSGIYEVLVYNFSLSSGLPYNYNFNTFTLTVSSGPTPGSATIYYYSTKNGALTEDSSKFVGSSSSSYKVGVVDTGSLGKVTRWNIASNSTGSSLKRYVYSNDVVLNHEGSPTYYLYPAKFKRSLKAKRVLNQSFKIVPVWEGYKYYMTKADNLGFSRLYYEYYVKKYNKKH